MSVAGGAVQSPVERVTPAELAELMSVFNEVTGRLEATHVQLRAEVARLNAELREAGEQLERSRRLAALGEMAAGIAHEVRNPLGSISLYAQMLAQDLADRPAEREIVMKISAAAGGLGQVVNDVLAFARELRLRQTAIDASEVIDRALVACEREMNGQWRGIEVVRADGARGAGRRGVMFVDGGLVHQALTNVIRNAVEAMAEQNSPVRRLVIEVASRRLSTEDGPSRRAVGVAVTDTGGGIAGDVVARMFNPFFTTRAAGTGLGLAIVHRIVDAHGGRITVTNTGTGAEKGARVELILPAADAAGEGAGRVHVGQDARECREAR